MGSFETDEQHSNPSLKPLRVASRRDGIYAQAKEMVSDLDGWTLQSSDDEAFVLECERKGGMLGGSAKITIRVEGPEGIPSTTVHVRSESTGGLRSRDKGNVLEFMKPFHRRVC
jgi:hypothetical protein